MYKRGDNNLESIKEYCVYASSSKDSYMNLGGDLNINKPYNGLYINKNKMFIQNIVEKIEIDHKSYRVGNFKTLSTSINTDEYLEIIEESNLYYEYNVKNVILAKKIRFLNDSNTLCIEYLVQNDTTNDVTIKVIPMVTYKDVLSFKKSEELKFNKFVIDSGIRIDLSVAQNHSVFLKSDKSKFKEIDSFLNNVVHELRLENGKKETIIEDLYIPGEFNIKVKSKEEQIFRVLISNVDFDITKSINNENKSVRKLPKVEEEFVELKKLAYAKRNFDNEYLTSSIPSYVDIAKVIGATEYNNTNFAITELIKIVNSIEGQYLIFKNVDKAESKIKQIIKYVEILEETQELDQNYEFSLLKLWICHLIYKIFERDRTITYMFESFIKKEAEANSYLLRINSWQFKNLEYVCLAYNLFKIYENMYTTIMYTQTCNLLKEIVLNKFYDERKKVLKINLEEMESYATAEMIYALSLAFPIVDLDIGIKILDTTFKELYTPYGLRKYSKFCSKNNGIIYPKYMAHFVKANLRQNGITFASKKIIYNLVKELLQDIDKNVLNSCKCIYHEKGYIIDKNGLDLLTTAEMIRLYDMLT